MYEEIFYDKKDGSFWDKETGVDLNIKTTPNCYGYAYIIYNKKYIALYRVIYYKEYSKEIPHNICVKYIDGNSNNLKYDNILFENKWEDNCQICGKLYVKNVKQQKFCSTDCLNINVEKTVAGDRLLIFERDKWRCLYCGASTLDDDKCKLTIDHIYPVSVKEDNTAKNLITCCITCNTAKQDKIYDEERLSILYKYTEKANKNYDIHQDKIIKGSHIR